ncbi:MAG: helix-turn-helix domain-containing protein [Tuberibacillus sp.]
MIGTRIRYYRKLGGYTLETLSEGICSVSYLSKIENGGNSSDDIIVHLCKRLGISYSAVDDSAKAEKLRDRMDEWYRVLVSYEEPETLEKERLAIEEDMSASGIEEPLIHLRFNLFTLRYRLFQNDLNDSKRLIKHLSSFKEIFDSELEYYFYHFCGIYYNIMNDYSNAIKCLKAAEEALKTISHTETEEAHLNYQFANLYSKFLRISDCMNYAEKALTIFNKDYNVTRISDCQTILGICNREIKNFIKAEYHYGQALKFAKLLNDPVRLGMIYHNLGFVKNGLGASEEAVEYYKQALKYKERLTNYDASKVKTMYLLAKEYLKMEQKEDCVNWTKQALDVAKKLADKEYFYQLKLIESEVENIKDETFESLIYNEAIPYFKKKERWDRVATHAENLADYYFQIKYYKKAGEMYRIANEARKKLS